ncbi:MAG TPA: hypothetical protein VFU55_03730 [Terracidiphilus sp.]|nr:hypothetical protein [Terracidiphilus sp.]
MHYALFLLLQQPSPEEMRHIMMAVFPLIGLFVIVALAIVIVPFWFICKKAGFSPWLSLLNIVPLGNLVLIYVLAFAEWKVMPAPQMGWPPMPPMPPPPPGSQRF